MSSNNNNKRAKVQLSVPEIIDQLPMLSRDTLLQIAESALESSSLSEVTLQLASRLVSQRAARMLHCVRCHEDYDPDYAGPRDCVMEDHDESEGMIRMGGPGGWDRFAWPCCNKMEHDNEPCFEGQHISDFSDGGHYWKDDILAENDSFDDC